MIASRFYYCAIPAESWKEDTELPAPRISRLVMDALNCERHISKAVNLHDEQTRYLILSRRIEQEIIGSGLLKPNKDLRKFTSDIKAGYLPMFQASGGYLSLLSRMINHPASDRLGASFYPPDQIGSHQKIFKQWSEQEGLKDSTVVQERLEFLGLAKKHKCGVVELQGGVLPNDGKFEILSDQLKNKESVEELARTVNIPDFVTSQIDLEFFGEKGKKQHLYKILINQIKDALKTNEPVSFGNQAPHDVITEALSHFVFVPDGERLKQTSLRIAYSDGSEAIPFPVFCLPRKPDETNPAKSNYLKVALMSMRHFELDPEIDLCWLRNREVSRTRTLAETDQFCYQITREQLRDSLKLGDLNMILYHTGFEPAVIGFYRGLVEQMLELRNKKSRANLKVIPCYFRGGKDYQKGSSWL